MTHFKPIVGDPQYYTITDTGIVERVPDFPHGHSYVVRQPMPPRRPLKHDWLVAERAVFGKIFSEGLPPGRGAKAQIVRWLEEWFDANAKLLLFDAPDCYPSETQLKEHARLIYETIEKAGKS